tara:strand:- start:134 stop:619 length:486 start_codon:yes stop_codon:yes gene_type:complete
MIILGIDPGLATTGYGFVKKEGGELQTIDYGVILTPAKTELPSRLRQISEDMKVLIKKYKPSVLSVEKLFFCKNVKTALDVGHCRGVILLEGMNADLPLYEFTPLQVKQAITGYGGADKMQMQKMVQTVLNLSELPRPDDAADALALAITLSNSINFLDKN